MEQQLFAPISKCPKENDMMKDLKKYCVLYANSGGVKEMVGDFGFGVSDIVDYKFENKIPPEVCVEELVGGFECIINNYNNLKRNVVPYEATMKMYFDSFRKTFYENS